MSTRVLNRIVRTRRSPDDLSACCEGPVLDVVETFYDDAGHPELEHTWCECTCCGEQCGVVGFRGAERREP